MSNDLVSRQLSIPGNQMAQLDPIPCKLDVPISVGFMGFEMSEPLQQHISSSMSTGQIGYMSNDVGPQLSSMSSLHGGNIESEAYAQYSQQYPMSDKSVGERIPTMLDSLSPHQIPTLNKRKAMEPVSPNSVPQNLSLLNKRAAQMEHRPWLQSISAPSKKTVQMQSVSNSPGSQSSASNKRSVPNKSGSSASKNQPGQMQTSARGQTESSGSVRSKMRESLAGALALASQWQVENAKVEKSSNGEAASSLVKKEEGSHPVDSNSGNADVNHSETTQTLKCDKSQLQSNCLLPDGGVSFSDNIFARDELLQGNGLSWVLEPQIDTEKKKELEMVRKQNPVNGKLGKNDLDPSLQSPEELAYQIEAELFKLFGGVNKKYKEKGRSLLFNLKDRNNAELRERVMSGEIPPERLCSMNAEELASKELSQWRQAKAEELAQKVVLPDVEVDIRRLVRKTHKGEFQVEVEQTDSAAVEVSNGTTIARPKNEAKQAPMSDRTVEKKNESDTAGGKSNQEDPNLTITIPSSEGPDPMQVLMGEDELKDSNFLPPIVSLDEFMQSLDSEPPFENLPGDNGKATLARDKATTQTSDKAAPPTSDKDDLEAGSESKSSGQASQDPVDPVPDKHGSIDASNLKSDSDAKPNDVATLKGEHVWEGQLQLNVSAMTPVICAFKSGEKTSTKEWPSFLEIKGRVRLDAFEKFLQELPMSRSRAVMVVHFVCKEGSTDSERGSLVEAADSYVLDGRVGFAEPASGVELYLCPPHAKTLEMLSKILPKDQLESLNAINIGLIGGVVWRRPQLISPNSTSNHKYTSKKQHFTSSSRRREEKNTSTNINTNFPSKPAFSHGGPPLHSKQNQPDEDDDDDDVPPGFGPPKSREEDDLPEFKFSGGSVSSGPQYPTIGYKSQRVGIASSHLNAQTSSRPVDQMRQLIHKYGQPNNAAPLGGVPMQQWNDDDDDDDDIPEWQPQTIQQPQPQAQPPQVHRFQLPMHAPQQLSHQPLHVLHVQGQHNVAQPYQQGTWWVPPPVSQDQQFVNGAQFYGTSGQPAWRKDAPNARGF